jgi:hypothetical protein
VSDRPLESLTLREKLIETEKLSRELMDHLERGFIPRIHDLRRLARRGNEPDHQDEVQDITIRNSVDRILQSDDYTHQLCGKARQLLAAIDMEVNTIFEGH